MNDMSYTVSQLAKLSGVSIRLLHWYDDIGLLKPAYHGSNGYRYYEKEQVLMLQQILFYRELGIGLKKIGYILKGSDFDKIASLKLHKQALQKSMQETVELINTIDKTITHLQEDIQMNPKELFAGFSHEKQAQFEQELIDRFGEEAARSIEESKEKGAQMSQADWEGAQEEFIQICQGLKQEIEAGQKAHFPASQALIKRHYLWLKQYWTPNQETYIQHGNLICDSQLREPYEKFHKDLPEFVREGILYFAENELE
ncbi:MAG: HTH-type transcriptional activator mta [Chlamydiia bacterium]|nr:HTH-type transcriptional activator mta [Chlamydiia bacterium]